MGAPVKTLSEGETRLFWTQIHERVTHFGLQSQSAVLPEARPRAVEKCDTQICWVYETQHIYRGNAVERRQNTGAPIYITECAGFFEGTHPLQIVNMCYLISLNITGTSIESSFSGRPEGLSFLRIIAPRLYGVSWSMVYAILAVNGTKSSVIHSPCAVATPSPTMSPSQLTIEIGKLPSKNHVPRAVPVMVMGEVMTL